MPISSEHDDPAEPEPLPPHDENLPLRPGRIVIAARQRGADRAALGHLALYLPHACASLTVVCGAAYLVQLLGGPPWWLLCGTWVLSGGLAFHQPFERILARRLFGLRHPTPDEDRILRHVWREVTARAGVNSAVYHLWVEDSDGVNAMAAAGHIIGVTRHSVRHLPAAQLAAVLAHELGHHARGHSWTSLLTFWYALPGRLTWRLLRTLASRVDRLPVGAAAVLIGLVGAITIALAKATYGLILLPFITPYLAAAVSRRAELRADEHAARLGFAHHLITVLCKEHEREEAARAHAAALDLPAEDEGFVARLLDSHPDLHTRLHHLRAHVQRGR
ncbi:M48 family metalloprotease [Streptomyces sp. NPDC005549]|uniref:M48 family metalloprotease n=1 Tax=Streptomyces sp. NPDC005549 TaxID=3154888 RepID=UPI0033AE07D0